MTRLIFSRNLLVLPLFCGFGILNAQNTGKIEDKSANKKATILREKTSGFQRCSTTEYENYLQAKFPERLNKEQFEAWLKPLIEKASVNKSQNGNIITIPVVVHVIHSGQNVGTAPNITDNQVLSQITVMNNDFRRIAGTPGFNTNLVGADTQIQFALAKVDPNGNPTNGIDRVNLCQDYWSQDHIDDVVKPNTIWDPNQYMNMWSVDFANSGLLGYAQFPSSSGLQGMPANGGLANTDGVVAGFSTFGSSDYNDGSFILGAPYDKGRTMTHEVGHFLGLNHIWGDSACGNDYCADTPTAHDANYVCNPTIASCDNPAIYEMVQNYMDYTNDTCMNVYTNDQKTRITTVMNNSPRRMQLKTSTKDIAIPLFANDAELKVDGSCTIGISNCGTGSIRFLLANRGTANLTSAVINYTFSGGTAQSYTWTGNLAQDKTTYITIPVAATVPTSTLTASIASVNGGTDQRASNNSANGNYTKPIVPQYYNNTNFTFRLLLDDYGSETKWNLKNSAGQIVKSGAYNDTQTGQPSPTLITQNWVLPADCYVFTISDDYGDGLEGTSYVDLSTSTGTVLYHASNFGYYATKLFTTQNTLGTSEVAKKNSFGIYPNPAHDVINISNISGKTNFEIHNTVGQLVKKGEVKNDQVNVSELIKGNYIITINNDKVSESIKFIKK